jgi:hypothetical protein
MIKKYQSLSSYKKDVYSQSGEDGIIEKIFKIIGTGSKVCIEFGAWNGFYLANTANLWTKKWKGILIEANKDKYRELIKNTKKYDCHCICEFVGFGKKNNLETILKNEKLSFDIDLLSIDIDSDDYYIFQSLKKLKPRVIVCEYNPSVPPHIEIVQPKNGHFGCSVKSLTKLAKRKGYELVAMTDTNAIFVQKKLFPKFRNFETDPEFIMPKRHLVYVFSDMSQEYVFSREPSNGCSHPSFEPKIGDYYVPQLHDTYMIYLKLFIIKLFKRHEKLAKTISHITKILGIHSLLNKVIFNH